MIETLFFSNESFGCSGEPTAWEVAHLRTTTWAASGHHLLGPVPNLHDAGSQPWPAPSVAGGEMSAIGSNSSDLKHHLSQQRRWLFWMRSLSIGSVGLNLDLRDVNAEFLERRNC